jgi:hypothetical protein
MWIRISSARVSMCAHRTQVCFPRRALQQWLFGIARASARSLPFTLVLDPRVDLAHVSMCPRLRWCRRLCRLPTFSGQSVTERRMTMIFRFALLCFSLKYSRAAVSVRVLLRIANWVQRSAVSRLQHYDCCILYIHTQTILWLTFSAARSRRIFSAFP